VAHFRIWARSTSGSCATASRTRGRSPAWRPVSGRCARRALAAAEQLLASGERRLRVLLSVLEATSLDEAWWRPLDPSGEWMRDVDRPEDLAG